MDIVSKLNYNLQSYADRKALVDFLAETGELDNLSPTNLNKVSNYLLYAGDLNFKKQVELPPEPVSILSLDEMTEGPKGLNAIETAARNSVRVKRATHKIDRDDPINQSVMGDLWEAIDNITEKYEYCRAVLEGKREPDPNRALQPTYANKYFYRQWMMDLRKEQFLIRDCVAPAVGTGQGLPTPLDAKPLEEYIDDTITVRVGSTVLIDGGDRVIDLAHPEMVSALLRHAKRTWEIESRPRLGTALEKVDILLGEGITLANLSADMEAVLDYKKLGLSNEQVVEAMVKNGYHRYCVNYVSTLWRKTIPRKIAEALRAAYAAKTNEASGKTNVAGEEDKHE